MDDDLDRFIGPVRDDLDQVVAELTAGRKRTHWMWFMFPQLRTLGHSDTARYYGLADLDEARRFLAHPELGPTYERLVGIVHDVVIGRGHRIHDVFGSPDDLKLVSSLTLFESAAEQDGPAQLAEQCRELLEAADAQGFAPCAVTRASMPKPEK